MKFSFISIAPTFLAIALLGGCASNTVNVGGTKENRAQRLAGEWISPANPNDYLVFKPDPTDAKQGRVLGLEKFDNYRITTMSALSPNLTLEVSSRDDAWEEHKGSATVAFTKDGRSITVTLPPEESNGRTVAKTYRHSSEF